MQLLQPVIQSCLPQVALVYHSRLGLIQLGFVQSSEFLLVLNLSSLVYETKHTKPSFLHSILFFHFIALFLLTVKK